MTKKRLNILNVIHNPALSPRPRGRCQRERLTLSGYSPHRTPPGRLFRSGVDGLDGRIATAESGDRISFSLGDRRLADVAVSPGSFTVSPGDGLITPIVVSDRVSLERALNSVVSLFVRDERTTDGGNGQGADVELTDDERSVLSDIWGAGVQASDRS